jgi:hypothetical protein
MRPGGEPIAVWPTALSASSQKRGGMEERRRSPRVPITEGLAVLPVGLTVRVMDISVNGVLLETSRALQRGSRASLRLNMGGTPFATEIEIQRVSAEGEGAGRYHLGATFLRISEADRQIIDRFTNQ